MSQLKLTADSGGGTVAIKGPASTAGNAAIELTVPGTGSGTLAVGATGKILQVIQAVKTDTATTTSENTFVDTGLSVSITPSSASNKILVTANLNFSAGDMQNIAWRLVRGSTDIYLGDAASNRTRAAGAVRVSTNQDAEHQNVTSIFLDSPNTTSATTYKVMWCRTYSTSTIYMNRASEDTNNDDRTRCPSSITVQEVAT